jgi:hypothetical protein
MIAFITFLDDEIAVQEYIFGVKVPYKCMIISKTMPHNRLPKTYESCMSFPLLSKLDLTLSSMDHVVGHG